MVRFLFKRHNLIYLLIAVSTAITFLLGHHAQLSQAFKAILGACNILAVWLMVKKAIQCRMKENLQIYRVGIFLIVYTFVYLIYALVFYPSHFMSIIFSPFYLLTFLLPLFYLLTFDRNFFNKFFALFVILAIISIFSFRGYGLSSYLLVLFYPRLRQDKRLIFLFIALLFFDLSYSINLFDMLYDSQRQLFVELCVAAIAWLLIWKYHNLYLAKRISFFLCISPFIIFTLFLVFHISIFDLGSKEIDNPILAIDSRTFLYYEMFANLKTPQNWIFGFGIDGTYYSNAFSIGAGDGQRNTIEVTMLHLILKGGLILLAFYLYFIYRAIYLGFRFGNNRLVHSCCVLLSGHLLCMCVGDYPSRSLLVQIIPFILVGFCFNEKFREASDEELYENYYLA